jgi:lysophospholipase L1-like esterase
MPSKSLFPFTLFLSLCFPLLAVAAPNPWEKSIAQFEQLEITSMPPNGSALFVGSSSIRMWRTLPGDLAPYPVINRGFGGSTIADCTYFIPRIVTPYQPAVIFLYAGDNDIAAGRSPEQVLADFKAFVAGCRKGLPSTPIQYISIKPSPARWNLWEKTRKANELIRQYVAGQKGLGYIDVATPMLDREGVVKGELFLSDRLHMNAGGYRLWTSVGKPKLAECMKAASSSKPESTLRKSPAVASPKR